MKKAKTVILVVALVGSIAINGIIYWIAKDGGFLYYLQEKQQIELTLTGILKANETYAVGSDYEFQYDFDRTEYSTLIEQYNIDNIAGEGSEFERAKRLMHEFSPRLHHESNFTAKIDLNALDLLDYSIDNKKNGINCRCKAQILNEMCLALGIYARKIWIMPYSVYDSECHVVNEIYDHTYKKWIMFDITNDAYWVDEDGTPLSVYEIRQYLADQIFCTPILGKDDKKEFTAEYLHSRLKKNYDNYLYILKNMAYFEYLGNYSVGEDDVSYDLLPEGYGKAQNEISIGSCTKAPDIS